MFDIMHKTLHISHRKLQYRVPQKVTPTVLRHYFQEHNEF